MSECKSAWDGRIPAKHGEFGVSHDGRCLHCGASMTEEALRSQRDRAVEMLREHRLRWSDATDGLAETLTCMECGGDPCFPDCPLAALLKEIDHP